MSGTVACIYWNKTKNRVAEWKQDFQWAASKTVLLWNDREKPTDTQGRRVSARFSKGHQVTQAEKQ